MKTKLLDSPIGLFKTQDSVRQLVQRMSEICSEMSKNAGLHCGPEHDKEVHLESANKFFQIAMFAGMLALLDESKTKVDVNLHE